MVEAALGHIRILEELDFHQIKVSLKASDVATNLAANASSPPWTTATRSISAHRGGPGRHGQH